MILSIRRTEHDLCTHISFRFNKYIREHNNILCIYLDHIITPRVPIHNTHANNVIIFNVTAFRGPIGAISPFGRILKCDN